MEERVEVAIVGGGPAGAVTAGLLAAAGHDVRLFERAPAYRWRACGVFSWTAGRQLRELGLIGDDIEGVATPVRSLRLVAPDRSEVRLRAPAAVGLDRATLDPMLLARARRAGATVCEGTAVEGLAGDRLTVRSGSAMSTIRADVVVGADGARSRVAGAFGVSRPARIGSRIGLTYHVAAAAPPPAPATLAGETVMTAFAGGYCGIAPVPGERLNVGIVLDAPRWSARLRGDGAAATADGIVRRLLRRDPALRQAVADPAPLDAVSGAVPLAHAVTRVSGDDWLLVGDAAGFLDPFTGDGLGRAFTTAALAADAVHRRLRGEPGALAGYAAAYRATYLDHDRLSLLVQQFVARPPLLSYAVRRAARRPAVRATLEAVLAEAIPARRGLDPRFLAALLRP